MAKTVEPIIGTKAYKINYNKWSEVEIGNKIKNDFSPHAKLKKWGEECFLTIEHPTIKKIKETIENGKIKWKDKDENKEIHFYPIENNPNDISDEGSFEFEIILNTKPISNIIALDIDFKNLDFYYQPELTQDEINEGCFRPDNVVGSYAVYNPNIHVFHRRDIDAEKYKCGKVFHIYRPKITDNNGNGNSIWGILNIDKNAKKLTITIDQTFLDNATYPLIIDPTFGYTTAGTSFVSETAGGRIRGSKFNETEIGKTSKVTTYSKSNTGGNITLGTALYDDDGAGVVSIYVSEDSGNATVTTTAAWVDTPLVYDITSPNLDYWLMFWSSVADKKVVYYDTGSANQGWIDGGGFTFESWPGSPTGGTYSTRKHSIYVTYSKTFKENYMGVANALIYTINGVYKTEIAKVNGIT